MQMPNLVCSCSCLAAYVQGVIVPLVYAGACRMPALHGQLWAAHAGPGRGRLQDQQCGSLLGL